MDRPEFTYVIYIAATAEAVYTALTSPEDTRYYWGNRNVSDWRVGSRWRHERQDGTASVVGRVLEAARPQRLRLSWSSPDADGDPARTSEVEFDIQGTTGFSRLTVTHLRLDPRNYPRIAGGWPRVLSNLKTWLEKRDVLPGLI